MSNQLANKEQAGVILTVSIGNVLEAFEIYSFAYLAPILASVFFNFDSYVTNLLAAFLVFAVGFFNRPLGGLIFGRIGDLIGRKEAYILSLLLLTIPTFLMGFIPSYSSIGIYAPILLIIMRLLQSIPAAGEAPGTFCFLYENSHPGNKKFMSSWGAFGNQIGAILGIAETWLMDYFLTNDQLMEWGWRISFWTGGLIGLFGLYLRRRLHETRLFQSAKDHHKLDHEKIVQVVIHHRKKILLGAGFGIINAATYYLIAAYIPTYFDQMLGYKSNVNILISLTILILTTLLLPVFGILAERLRVKRLFIASSFVIIGLLVPLYFAILNQSVVSIATIGLLFILPVTCMTALLPYLLAHTFPTPIRFTGVGLSFNLAEGFIGGFTPAIALFLLQYSNNQAAFCWFILICSVLSLISYFMINEDI